MRRRRLARLGSSQLAAPAPSLAVPGPSGTNEKVVEQRLEEPTPCSTETAMDIEDNDKQCNTTFGGDVDSGIDTMEVEESDRKDPASRSRVI